MAQRRKYSSPTLPPFLCTESGGGREKSSCLESGKNKQEKANAYNAQGKLDCRARVKMGDIVEEAPLLS